MAAHRILCTGGSVETTTYKRRKLDQIQKRLEAKKACPRGGVQVIPSGHAHRSPAHNSGDTISQKVMTDHIATIFHLQAFLKDSTGVEYVADCGMEGEYLNGSVHLYTQGASFRKVSWYKAMNEKHHP